MLRLFSIPALVVLILATWLSISSAAPMADALHKVPGKNDPDLQSSVLRLKVQPERPAGYKRALFPHWDELGNGCSVRESVLLSESLTKSTVDPKNCTVRTGRWVSVYDGIVSTTPSDLDIDHVVALKEAWDSGAWSWSAARRRAFANDLSDPRTLIAVSATSNRKKSDKDPSSWLPQSSQVCAYLESWVSIKLKWDLSVDEREQKILLGFAKTCPNSPTTSTVPDSPASTAPSSTASVYYASCSEARSAGAAPLFRNSPGYRPGLDRDGDGVACE